MTISKKHILYSLGVLGLAGLLAACGSDDSELRRYINKVKSRPAKPIEPIPEVKPLPKFSYPEDDTRRSPFKPLVLPQQMDKFAPNTQRPKQPLEAFPLDALKFVGLLKQGSTVWALIAQPGGLITRVTYGNFMGKNYGRIILIKDKSITLEETIQIGGKWEKKEIKIDLRVPE